MMDNKTRRILAVALVKTARNLMALNIMQDVSILGITDKGALLEWRFKWRKNMSLEAWCSNAKGVTKSILKPKLHFDYPMDKGTLQDVSVDGSDGYVVVKSFHPWASDGVPTKPELDRQLNSFRG